jgi:hypothetical protein
MAMSRKGPVARPAGFHHVAVLSFATATNAPPIPRARCPTASKGWAAAGDPRVRSNQTGVRN